MLVVISSSLRLKPSVSIPSSSSSSPASQARSFVSTRTSNFSLPISRRDFIALLSIAAASFVVFSLDPLPSSALSSSLDKKSEMRSRKDSNRRSRPSSPVKDRTTTTTTRVSSRSEERTSNSGVSLVERDLVTEEGSLAEEHSAPREASNSSFYLNPRSFPYSVKQQCWDKAEKIKGRDPDRWRRDPLGNLVFRKLVGCAGCLCHDYDHIVPYSKGGPSTLENCQVLQATVNRSKGNRTEYSRAELIQKSSYCRVSGRDMDLLELSAYGNVRHVQDSGGCRIQ